MILYGWPTFRFYSTLWIRSTDIIKSDTHSLFSILLIYKSDNDVLWSSIDKIEFRLYNRTPNRLSYIVQLFNLNNKFNLMIKQCLLLAMITFLCSSYNILPLQLCNCTKKDYEPRGNFP